jgi:hypothetical protein
MGSSGSSGGAGGVGDPTMGGDMTGTASNAQIAAGSVGTAEIATDGVNSAEIATNAVQANEIEANAVGASEIAAGALTAADAAADLATQAELDVVATTISDNAQTGTSYTLVLGDAGLQVSMNNASANTVTVPPNSSVAFPVNTVVQVYQYGAGLTTIVAGAGVTIRAFGGFLASGGRYAVLSLRKRATDEWELSGLTASA